MDDLKNQLSQYIKDQLEIEEAEYEDNGFCYSFQQCELEFVEDAITNLDYVSHRFLVDRFGETVLFLSGDSETIVIDTRDIDAFSISLDGGEVILTHDIGLTVGCVRSEYDEPLSDDALSTHVDGVIELFTAINESYQTAMLQNILKAPL